MQTGMLPDQMVLDNNDEVWYDEAEEVDEAVDLDGTAFPLRLGKNLQGAPTSELPMHNHATLSQEHIAACEVAASPDSMPGCQEELFCSTLVDIVCLGAVLKLGRIEWMRPTYHTKKHIYPVGYTAVRAVELSATRGSSVQCLCEIRQSADSFEPVFRYTIPL